MRYRGRARVVLRGVTPARSARHTMAAARTLPRPAPRPAPTSTRSPRGARTARRWRRRRGGMLHARLCGHRGRSPRPTARGPHRAARPRAVKASRGRPTPRAAAEKGWAVERAPKAEPAQRARVERSAHGVGCSNPAHTPATWQPGPAGARPRPGPVPPAPTAAVAQAVGDCAAAGPPPTRAAASGVARYAGPIQAVARRARLHPRPPAAGVCELV